MRVPFNDLNNKKQELFQMTLLNSFEILVKRFTVIFFHCEIDSSQNIALADIYSRKK